MEIKLLTHTDEKLQFTAKVLVITVCHTLALRSRPSELSSANCLEKYLTLCITAYRRQKQTERRGWKHIRPNFVGLPKCFCHEVSGYPKYIKLKKIDHAQISLSI